jgi:hypothetical protein
MRLTKLLVTLCVTAMAFALFGANARAATVGPGGTASVAVHVDDNTVPVGLFCPSEFAAPDVCPRIPLTTTATGTLTVTTTLPAGQDVDLVLCANPTAVDATPVDNCPNGDEATSCVQTKTANTDGTTTVTLTCVAQPAGSYELEIVPVFVNTCPLPGDPGFDPDNPCFFGPGINITVVFTLTSGGTGGTQGGGGTGGVAKVTGGGKVNTNQETFSLEGWNAVITKGKVHYKNNKKCQFRSTDFQVVQVTPAGTGGTARFVGHGFVSTRSDEKDKTSTPFTLDVTDNGKGSTVPDQFTLNASYCSTSGPVVSGNIEVHS